MSCRQCDGSGTWVTGSSSGGVFTPTGAQQCPLCDGTGEQLRTWPFSCGTQSLDWKSRNCEQCAKGYSEDDREWRCEIERAIDDGYMGDGTVPMDTWRRMGGEASHASGGFPLTWDCLERELEVAP